MFERYTEVARRAIFFARYEASQYGGHQIEVTHLLLGLARESPATFSQITGVDPNVLWRAIEALCVKSEERFPPSVDLALSPACNRALRDAANEADDQGHRHIAPEHLILGVLRENGPEAQALAAFGISAEKARRAFVAAPQDPAPILHSWLPRAPADGMNRDAAKELLGRLPDAQLAAAVRILAGLSSRYCFVSGVSADGPFAFSFGTIPPTDL